MTRIFYIIEQEVIMATLIGFSENFRTTRPTFKVSNLKELKPYEIHSGQVIHNCYVMDHNGP